MPRKTKTSSKKATPTAKAVKSKRSTVSTKPLKEPTATKAAKVATAPGRRIKTTVTPRAVLAGVRTKSSKVFEHAKTKGGNYLRRRPHRSFRLTRRRDYVRSFTLPGYFAFTLEVLAALWRHKVTFSLLGLCFFGLFVVFNLMGTQDNYQKFQDLIYETSPDSLFGGVTGKIEQAGLLLYVSVTQNINNTPTTGQQVGAAAIAIYIWLSIVWLLRSSMAGRKVKLRDGLYNAGAPIIPMILMVITLLVQLIPLAIGIIIATAAGTAGFLDQGAWAMLAAIGIALLATVSLYWVTSTLIAMIIVTLPGMYPMRALAIAGDLVVGRRLRLVYRFVWMVLSIASLWVVVMIPVILFDGWIKSIYEPIAWLPIVPAMLLVMSTVSLFWSATYTYLLYRKMVDDDASPA